MALPRLFAFTNTHTLSSGQALQGDIYFSPDTGLITPNYTRSRPEISEHVTRIDLKGEYVVAPGYLEVQTNGLAGVHFTNLGSGSNAQVTEDDAVKLQKVSRELAKHGVTGFLATVPTVAQERWPQILSALRPQSFEDGATLLGAHVEGPYLNPSKQGAHDNRFFQKPILTAYQQLYGEDNLRSVIKLITLAPELPGAIDMIKSIRQTYPHITISLGHSAATYEQGQTALNAGARGLTHLYNAMNTPHHREPGLAGLIANNASSDNPPETLTSPSEQLLSSTTSVTDWLARHMSSLDPSLTSSTTKTADDTQQPSKPKPKPEVFFSLIPDLIHVHPSSLTIAHRTAPHKSILITDSIELTGLPDGEYPPNNQITDTTQTKVGDRVTKTGTDILIGSCSTLDQCVRNMVEHCGCTLAEAVRCVTENVARYLEGDINTMRGRGRLDVGCRADFVVLDHAGHVRQTWIEGRKVWDCDDGIENP